MLHVTRGGVCHDSDITDRVPVDANTFYGLDWLRSNSIVRDGSESLPASAGELRLSDMPLDRMPPLGGDYRLTKYCGDSEPLWDYFNLSPFVSADGQYQMSYGFASPVALILINQTLGYHTRDTRIVLR
jgi:hypothetical protein